MNDYRKAFLVILVLALIITIAGIVGMSVMEYQARAALPIDQQNAKAIAEMYDGAVCLGCDLARMSFAMFGSAFVVLALFCWGIYEIGRVLLKRGSTSNR